MTLILPVSFTFTGSVAVTYVAPRLTLTVTSVTNPTALGTPSSTVVQVGEVVILKGCIGAGANEFNSAVKIVDRTATTLVVDFLTAPTTTPVNGSFGASGTLSLNRVAWNENAAIGADSITTAYTELNTGLSNLNQLTKFGMVFTVDGVTYSVDNCAVDQS